MRQSNMYGEHVSPNRVHATGGPRVRVQGENCQLMLVILHGSAKGCANDTLARVFFPQHRNVRIDLLQFAKSRFSDLYKAEPKSLGHGNMRMS